jgi:toxin ParE1/3/4
MKIVWTRPALKHLDKIGMFYATREIIVPHSPYVIAYRLRDTNVEVLAVVHGARQWPDTF